MPISESSGAPTPESEDGPGLAFKVYITASDLEEAAVLEALCPGNAEDAENFKVEKLVGQKTQHVIQRHRDANHNESGTNSKLFLVFDSPDLSERGTLLVTLDEYHGFDDGVRLLPDDANGVISSMSISNEDWYTVRQDVPDSMTPMIPLDHFALYNALTRREDFNYALMAMNKGLQDVGVSDPAEEGDVDELPKFYKPVRALNRNLDQIISDHPLYAHEQGLDEAHFALIDGEYRHKGALLVQVSPDRDSFRCEGEVAGEILRWVFINLMTWDDAKDLAGGQ
ncbi:hypothetical protein E4U42_003814 [Claviceps africana]|uniref:Uncharacterized protein n=1 Tax=Claviceps africana TaxID=83212 RepID=A0A8K0J653_9HYPO|nr:hypothetical protein E4U42_003814 [Claviceps africana]